MQHIPSLFKYFTSKFGIIGDDIDDIAYTISRKVWGKNLNKPEEPEEPEEPETITPKEDDRLASSMHQPFESRLNKAFGLMII